MTFAEQQAYVARALQDTGNDLWGEQLIKDLINEGLQEICGGIGYLKRYVAFVQEPAEGDAGLYIPDYQYEMDEVLHLQTDKTILERTSIKALAEGDIDWETREGSEPTSYIPHEYKRGTVKLDRTPDAALTTLKGLITYLHPVLTADGEECELPRDFHVLPCYYALAEAYATDNEGEAEGKDNLWRIRYERRLAKFLVKANRNFDRTRPTSRTSFL